MTISYYAGETHRIVADRQGRRILLGWANGMDPDEMAVFEAYFGSIWMEEVPDSYVEALEQAEGLEMLGHR